MSLFERSGELRNRVLGTLLAVSVTAGGAACSLDIDCADPEDAQKKVCVDKQKETEAKKAVNDAFDKAAADITQKALARAAQIRAEQEQTKADGKYASYTYNTDLEENFDGSGFNKLYVANHSDAMSTVRENHSASLFIEYEAANPANVRSINFSISDSKFKLDPNNPTEVLKDDKGNYAIIGDESTSSYDTFEKTAGGWKVSSFDDYGKDELSGTTYVDTTTENMRGTLDYAKAVVNSVNAGLNLGLQIS